MIKENPLHHLDQQKIQSLLEKLQPYLINNSEDEVKDLLQLEIEQIKYEERSAAVAIATMLRSNYVRHLLPFWEEVGNSEKLLGMLEIENKLKKFQQNCLKRINILEKK